MGTPEALESPVARSAPPVRRAIRSKSPTRIALERLRRDKVAVVCFVVVVVFLLVAAFANVITWATHTSPTRLDQGLIDQYGFPTVGPSAAHPFGIEPLLGRDLFARWVMGARTSFIIAVSASVVTTAIGLVAGLLAGFLGGWVDRVISWLTDFFLSLPLLLFVIAIVPIVQSHFGTGTQTVSTVRLWSLVAVLALFSWTGLARLIRAEVLSLREREFVQAARTIGVPTSRILLKEMLPNMTGQLIIFLSLSIPGFIAAEAGLSLLGVGLLEPTASWGRTISDATGYFQTDPLYFWQPVAGIAILVLALNLLGDSVRDAFDPKTRR